MTPKELATLLHRREYRDEMTKEMRAAAKAHGLVVIYGASDDLMEFDGAIYDEVSAYGGIIVHIDNKGLLPDFDDLINEYKNSADQSKLRDYFQRESKTKTIEAIWSSGHNISWTYKTDIPHETFEILEDNEIYCRGIVFSLEDV
jgi:hypothetical protein